MSIFKKTFILVIMAFNNLSLSFAKENLSPGTPRLGGNLVSLLDLASKMKSVAESLDIDNAGSCSEKLGALVNETKDLSQPQLDVSSIVLNGESTLQALFDARVALHSRLNLLSHDCALKARQIFKSVRLLEDLVGVIYFNDQQVNSKYIKFDPGPTPIYNHSFFHPYHTAKGINPLESFQFKTGDIMITRGVSYVSSSIAQLPDESGLFSHIVFVYVDEKTKKVETIESYVGKGVLVFNMDSALRFENARILVLRPKNSEMGKRAANFMYRQVKKLKSQGITIPYDYNMDFKDHSRMSCEEVAQSSYEYVSGGKVNLPEWTSNISFKNKDFLSGMGLRQGPLMVPSDMETDSRFDIALDWTDYRLVRDSWRKDAVSAQIFNWINEKNYQLQNTGNTIKARSLWALRPFPGIWDLAKLIPGNPFKDYSADVPSNMISTITKVFGVADVMLRVLETADSDHLVKHGYWMSQKQLRETLEDFRIADLKVYSENPSKAKLAPLFRSK